MQDRPYLHTVSAADIIYDHVKIAVHVGIAALADLRQPLGESDGGLLFVNAPDFVVDSIALNDSHSRCSFLGASPCSLII